MLKARYDPHWVESAIKRIGNYRKLPKATMVAFGSFW